MMALPPNAVNGISHTLDGDASLLSSSLLSSGVNINEQGQESDVRHEPLHVTIDKLDGVSTKAAMGTPLDPDSIPINPPKGTPPPPTGQLLQDVQMAEEASPVATPNGVIQNGATGGHENHEDIEMTAPLSNGIKRQASDADISQDGSATPDQQQTQTHQSSITPSISEPIASTSTTHAALPPSASLPATLIRQSQDTNGEDDHDRPPPAKRARKLSDADQASVDHSVNGHTFSASPAPAPPTTAPPSPQSTLSSISFEQYRFSKHAVRTLKKMKDAGPFLHPVDAEALGIPHYRTIITSPMDLSTVERKLDSSNPVKPDRNAANPRYYHIDGFIKDVKLIVKNCITFNGADHPISQMGKRVEAVFDKQVKQMPAGEEPHPIVTPKPPVALPQPPPVVAPKKAEKPAPPARRASTSVPVIRRSDDVVGRPKREIHPPAPKDLPYADPPKKPRRAKVPKDDGTAERLKYCSKIISDMYKKQYWNFAAPFYDPVDYVALGIPSYPKIIKHPMDLSTMKKKLDNKEYRSPDKFHADFKQMLANCNKFNPPGSAVFEAGAQMQKLFEEKWAGLPPLRTHSESEDDDDEDEDEDEDEKARIVSMMRNQIEQLNRNLQAMDSSKKKKEKKEKHRDKYAPSTSAGPSKTSSSKGAAPNKKKNKKMNDDDVLSFEQKKDLSDTIGTLSGTKLEKVIQIIHEGVPEIRDSTEEIELDIDSLPPAVLTKLYNFVLRPLRPAPKRSRGTGGGTGGLKRKSMDEDAEAERIRKLEQRIALFDDKNGGAAAAAVTGSSARKDDDSVHSSEESSEESSASDSE